MTFGGPFLDSGVVCPHQTSECDPIAFFNRLDLYHTSRAPEQIKDLRRMYLRLILERECERGRERARELFMKMDKHTGVWP